MQYVYCIVGIPCNAWQGYFPQCDWLTYWGLLIRACLSPLLSFPILPHPILSYPIPPYPILSYPILSYPILSYPILYYPILSPKLPGWVAKFERRLMPSQICRAKSNFVDLLRLPITSWVRSKLKKSTFETCSHFGVWRPLDKLEWPQF